MKPPQQTLRNAAHYLMQERPIWYDMVPNEKGHLVHGPYREAVNLLCRLASDIQAETGAGDVHGKVGM